MMKEKPVTHDKWEMAAGGEGLIQQKVKGSTCVLPLTFYLK